MKKRVLAVITAIMVTSVLFTGCIGNSSDKENIESSTRSEKSEESLDEIEYEDDSSDIGYESSAEEKEDNVDAGSLESEDSETLNDKNAYFFSKVNSEFNYSVKNFLYENGVEEVPVSVKKLASYDDGDVYSIKIQHKEFEESYEYDAETRMNVGTFYVTPSKIYVLMYRDDTPSEDEFLSNGIVVYSDEDLSEDLESEQEHVEIKNDGDTCTCSMWSTVGESGFYYTYEWTKGKGLTLFRSGYGAEGEPIEISLER